MRKLILLTLFLFVTPLNLVVSLWLLANLAQTKLSRQFLAQAENPKEKHSQIYAALPEPGGEVLGEATAGDARPIIIEKYLKKHHSPLLPYAAELLGASEKYEVDYRLIVAIAQCESNLCKKSPPDSYNCWGFENGTTKFLSWEQALNQVAKTLREDYLNEGLETPEEIMTKYAPPSVEKGGPWAKCVAQFIEELENGEIE